MVKTLSTKVKRGDTIVEVMFAFAVFALVAILSIAMMNAGVATGERSLELVVARNEINAQAEAIRFIHSSYVSELTLPECGPNISAGEKCQQFDDLWETITNNAVDSTTYDSIPTQLNSCQEVYDNNNEKLEKVNAFVLNVRKLGTVLQSDGKKINSNDIYINSKTTQRASLIFQPAPYGARLIYNKGPNSLAGDDENIISVQQPNNNPADYTNLVKAEGIWVVAVKDTVSHYYDFRIQACWYGSGNVAPTTLDTVIRLNNPENL